MRAHKRRVNSPYWQRPDREWLVHEKTTLDKKCGVIAKEVGVDLSTISRWLKAEKVAVPRGRPRKEVPTREWLKHQCAVLHKSLEEIGLERGVSRETVRSWLLEAKIPLTLRRHRRHGSL